MRMKDLCMRGKMFTTDNLESANAPAIPLGWNLNAKSLCKREHLGYLEILRNQYKDVIFNYGNMDFQM